MLSPEKSIFTNNHKILNILEKLLCTKKSYLYLLEWEYKVIYYNCSFFILKIGIKIYFNQICSIYIFNGSAADGGIQFIVPTFQYRGLESTAVDLWNVKALISCWYELPYSMTKLHVDLPTVIWFGNFVTQLKLFLI